MFATVVVVIAVVVSGIIDLSTTVIEPSYSIFNYKSFPLAIGTIAFSYGGINVYPQIEHGMKHPKKFSKVLNLAIITTTLMYILVAIFGYAVYGENVQSPILKSLPNGILKFISTSLITAHVFLAAPIFLCSLANEIEQSFNITKETLGYKKELTIRIIGRGSMTLIITLIAMFVPYFNDFMSLFGAVTNCVLVFILPIVYHSKLIGNHSWKLYILDFVVISMGLIGLTLGTYQSVSNLIFDFRGEHSSNVSLH